MTTSSRYNPKRHFELPWLAYIFGVGLHRGGPAHGRGGLCAIGAFLGRGASVKNQNYDNDKAILTRMMRGYDR
jgi:hypothetical protein